MLSFKSNCKCCPAGAKPTSLLKAHLHSQAKFTDSVKSMSRIFQTLYVVYFPQTAGQPQVFMEIPLNVRFSIKCVLSYIVAFRPM